jgi:carbon storage regulator CsrA
MLVLTRKANQQIQIGDNVVVTILQIKGNTVRVGIEAPRDVRVIRGELKGIDANKTVVEITLTEESAAVESRAKSASSSLRQSPVAAGSLRDDSFLPLQPGLAASAVVADFTPMRQPRRAVAGERRGLRLATR